ncbi:hotdog fold thioesterase [Celerinatantimonas yamalensis]|uniref:Hotdog fold thioesterase n=1 Tax=Celerinatantimonas yamalensis TaxID=559956 RepID=A0ABW9G4A9_9GAMM
MNRIWQKEISLERLNAMVPGTMLEAAQIQFSEFGDDYLSATMPITDAVRQPMGLLHGGASAALAETVGSIAGFFACPEGCHILGTEIIANHLKAMHSGSVVATATPIRLGGLLQLWQINISNQADPNQLVCSARHSVIVRHK